MLRMSIANPVAHAPTGSKIAAIKYCDLRAATRRDTMNNASPKRCVTKQSPSHKERQGLAASPSANHTAANNAVNTTSHSPRGLYHKIPCCSAVQTAIDNAMETLPDWRSSSSAARTCSGTS